MNKKWTYLLIFLLFSYISPGCGQVTITGGSSSLSDSTPTGNIVFQGTFTSVSSDTFSGVAAIYLTTSGSFTARLQSFSTSSSSTLKVVGVDGNGNDVFTSTLRAQSGDQNYSTGASNGSVISWSAVNIETTTGDIVATALLQSTS